MSTPDKRYLDPALKLLDPRTRDLEPARGDLGFSGGLVKAVDVDARSVSAVVSTPNVDRYEEIVEPSAFKKWLPTFLENPVFMAGHVTGGFSGEPTVIGSWSDMRITDRGLLGTATFAETPLAEEFWRLYADNHMRAFSVGWITHNWEMREFELGGGVTKKIRVFTEVELVEVSAVAIPANRESLVRAASALVQRDQQSPAALTPEQQKQVMDLVTQTITKCLNTEPGSRLCTLMQDVVETAQGAGADGGYDDVRPNPNPASNAMGVGDVDEFMEGLRDAMS